jgi:poly-gamma-glutamate synthesis protein (capsule biosynthesis protein)
MLLGAVPDILDAGAGDPQIMTRASERPAAQAPEVTLFLCGDVMTGRGIDQILPHSSRPELFEPYVRTALEYVEIAERKSGPIPRGVDPAYVWGDALAELERAHPAARIVNLETAVTASEDAWPGKGIHYRMHPENAACLGAAGIDCCVLANNHVLDWGYRGLAETIATLRGAGLRTAGAGRDAAEAAAPAVIPTDRARVLVFAFGSETSGVPPEWAATAARAGVSFVDAISAGSADAVARRVQAEKRAGDLAVVSMHWGANWGYRVSRAEREFAHRLIDSGAVDLVHGHSSHHPKAIEIFRNKLILYGCGDFLNDYEGIGGYEEFQPGLALMYFATLAAADGRLIGLELVPTRVRRFRIERVRGEGARWLAATLTRESADLGTRLEQVADDRLILRSGSL